MNLRRIFAALLAAVLFTALPMALAQTGSDSSDTPGIDRLAGAFFNGETINGKFTTKDPVQEHNPFGGPVEIDLGPVTIDNAFGMFVNPGESPVPRDLDQDGFFNDFGPTIRLRDDPTLGGANDQILIEPGDSDGNGVLDVFDDAPAPNPLGPPNIPFGEPFLPSSFPGPHSETLQEVAIQLVALNLQSVEPVTVVIDGVEQEWNVDVALDALNSGQPVRFGDRAVIVPPEGGGTTHLGNDGVFVFGAQGPGSVDLSQCQGVIDERTIGLGRRDSEGFPPDFAPFDVFAFTDDQYVVRCVDGDTFDPLQRLHYNPRNGRFAPTSTGALSVVVPNGWMTFVPGGEVQGADGFMAAQFRTDAATPFQTDTVGYTRQPTFPELIPMTEVPFIAQDGGIADFGPWPGDPFAPLILTFGNGTCDPRTWGGTFEHHLDMDTDGDGVPDLTRQMVLADGIRSGITQYSSGQASEGRTFIEELRIFAEGSGPNYQESYTYPGKYVHQFGDGAPCEWDLGIDDTYLDHIDEAIEAAFKAAEDAIAAAAATTTTAGATTTTLVAAADVDSDALPDAAEVQAGTEPAEEGGGGGGLIFLVLFGLAAVVALAYWGWSTFHTPPPWTWPCWPEYVAWQQAKAACDKATKEAKEKRKKANEARDARKAAEKKMKEHCRACPPACRPPSSASSGGRTVTSEDVWIQNQWAADAWSNYTPGDAASAQATENQWRQPPDAAFRAKKEAELAAARARTPQLQAEVDIAKADEAAANAAAEAAEAAAAEACDKAAKAKAAYDACIGAATADAGAPGAEPGAPGAEPGEPGGVPGGPGGAAVATDKGKAAKGCEPERRAYEAAQKACDKAEADADAAQDAADEAEDALEDAEEALEDYCEQNPPNCRQDWAEEAGRPETRLTTMDIHMQQAWAEQVMADYSSDAISAQEAEQSWQDGPPPDFVADEQRRLEDAKPLKQGLEDGVKAAEEAAANAAEEAAEAEEAAAEACAEAEKARKVFEDCVKAAGG